MDSDEGFIPCLSLSNPTRYVAYLSRFIPRVRLALFQVLDDVVHHPSSYHHRYWTMLHITQVRTTIDTGHRRIMPKYWTSSHNAQVCTTIGTGRCRTTPGLIGMPSTTIGAWCRRTTSLVVYSCPWDNPVLDDVAHHPSSYHHRYWTSSHNAQVRTTIGTGCCHTTSGLIGMPSTTIGAWCRCTTPLVIYSCPWDNPVVPLRNPPRQCSLESFENHDLPDLQTLLLRRCENVKNVSAMSMCKLCSCWTLPGVQELRQFMLKSTAKLAQADDLWVLNSEIPP
ncbi:hypothetical protein Cgig2_002844 [Carnegiea gigantea]|uniref:Uncharacterized protein n=1 Tax=Carnegiea gigantea TaxID=171969 RepID=A0A9Q1QLG8_9CARY|nr:hypothetical protein Cgig2_002844 [Carnegiea gigantea]